MRRIGELTIYESLDEVDPSLRPTVLTIGVFDGVHLGHQSLMRTVVERAHERDATPIVVTFDRHPLEVIAPEQAPPLLTTLPQRVRAMEELGIRAVVVLRFDDELRGMPAEAFVRDILVDRLGCVHVVIGANFRFGYRQQGTIETLNDLGANYGFDTTIFALVSGTGETVSSTLIRRHITEGSVERAAEELGRPFKLEGYVEHGAGRGKGLGFPTANLRVPARMLLPKLGVYAGWLRWQGGRYPAVTNVGVNPTFGDRETPIVEVHVLDFDRDLYGQVVELEFTHRLRDELWFEDVAALVDQIGEDVRIARGLLGASKP